MTTASSGLFTGTTTPTTVPFHPLIALASFIFANHLRQAPAGSAVDQAHAAVTWGL